MPPMGRAKEWLIRTCLRLVPERWRDQVSADLSEEANGRGRGTLGAAVWRAWQTAKIGAALRREARRNTPVEVRRPRLLMRGFGSDLRLAIRAVRRDPASTAMIVMTLALGIGAATATHAVFNYALFRPVPGVADQDRLATIYFQPNHATPSRVGIPPAYFRAMRDGVAGIQLTAGQQSDLPVSLHTGDEPRLMGVTWTRADYFQVLRARATLGRLPTASEYEAANSSFIVIGERLWRAEFGADRGILGRDIRVNGHPFPVIGVVASFRGLHQVGSESLWVPAAARHAFAVPADNADWPSSMSVVGRLLPGVTVEQAQAQMQSVVRSLGEIRRGESRYGPAVFAGLSDGVGQTRASLLRMYRLLMVGVVMVFVLACANAANLTLARHARRRGDLALRAAIGAARPRLIRELLTEAGMISLVAAAVGLLAGAGLTAWFRGDRVLTYLPALDDLAIDWRVALFAMLAAPVTLIVFGIVPALSASRVDLRGTLGDLGRTTPRAARTQMALVSLQLALSLALMVGTGLLVQTVSRLQSLDLGLNPDGVVEFFLRPPRTADDEQRARLFRETIDRLGQAPQVEGAAVSWYGGPFGARSRVRVQLPGAAGAEPIEVGEHLVSSDYFNVLRMPIRAGRTFTRAEEDAGSAPESPILINERLASTLFGAAPAVGLELEIPGRKLTRHRVIGVVGDVRNRQVREGFKPMIYQPIGRAPRIGTILLRSSLPDAEAIALARRTVFSVDQAVPISEAGTLREHFDAIFTEEQLLAKVSSVLAILAAILATAGLYAVVTFFVAERTREFGIRMALGATRPAVIAHVLARVARLCLVGFALGGLLLTAGARVLSARLYGISALDPLTIAAAALSLLLAASIAAWLPARRATRIDPTVALREM